MSVYEIVPNLSEGRDPATIDAASAAAIAAGARVLHRTSDAVHHRSVLTIAGTDRAVLEASVAIAGVASERIDVRAHAGVHPRIGALDVLPFVPLAGGTLERAVELAHEAGARIWERYRIPSFFYGAAARTPERALLAAVRRGQFEGLEERFATQPPDVGDVPKHPSAGAIAIGARPILIAFNIQLRSGDLGAARRIARRLREGGGGLKTLRALGLQLDERTVQLSFNVTEYESTPLYRIVELARHLAADEGISIEGSELIGCIPRAAVEAAARYYLGVPSDS